MITVTVTNATRLSGMIAPDLLRQIRDRLTFPNPQWIENDKRGFWNGNTPRALYFLKEEDDSIVLPRGFTRQLIGILKDASVPYQIDDRRRIHAEVDFTFREKLRDFQSEAVKAIFTRDFGTLSAPTGSGKTVMALALVTARKQPALVVCHTSELADQWVDRIETFLGIPAGEVGRIGGGKQSIGKQITVALVQSLYKCAADVSPHVGHLVVDEVHRCPSRTFLEAVTAFDCRYQLGLSATPWRRDGLSRLIWFYVGDKVHEIDQATMIETGNILRAEVITRETSFVPTVDPSEQYSRMLSELTEDPARNALICGDVAHEARNGAGIVLVLTDRKAHCEALHGILEAHGIHVEVLTGELPAKQRQQVVENLNAGNTKVLVATGQLIGEGFDCRELSTLFLATPIKFNGRLIQYLGRILRPAPGKGKARVFDYVDVQVGVLKNAARARARVYEKAA